MRIIKSFLFTSLICILGTLACAGDIVIMDAYARSSGNAAKVGAAFLVIQNNSDSQDRLISASSTVCKIVQLHTHKKGEDGVIKMRHVEEGFIIPAGGMHMLKRGADHIMFMGLFEPWEHEDSFDVTLTFERAGEIKINITVDMEREGSSHDH